MDLIEISKLAVGAKFHRCYFNGDSSKNVYVRGKKDKHAKGGVFYKTFLFNPGESNDGIFTGIIGENEKVYSI